MNSFLQYYLFYNISCLVAKRMYLPDDQTGEKIKIFAHEIFLLSLLGGVDYLSNCDIITLEELKSFLTKNSSLYS